MFSSRDEAQYITDIMLLTQVLLGSISSILSQEASVSVAGACFVVGLIRHLLNSVDLADVADGRRCFLLR